MKVVRHIYFISFIFKIVQSSHASKSISLDLLRPLRPFSKHRSIKTSVYPDSAVQISQEQQSQQATTTDFNDEDGNEIESLPSNLYDTSIDSKEENEATETLLPSTNSSQDSTMSSSTSIPPTSSPSLSYLILSNILSLLLGNVSSSDDRQPHMSQSQNQSLFSLLMRLGFISYAISNGLFSNNEHKAYMPPPQQHYMFERINDRYQKDSQALCQALNPNYSTQKGGRWWWLFTGGRHSSSNIRANSVSRTPIVYLSHAQINRQRQKQLQQQKKTKQNISGNNSTNNPTIKTAIVLELTTNDLTSDDIEEFRDKITFILDQYHSLFEQQELLSKALLQKKISNRKKKSKHLQQQQQQLSTTFPAPLLEVILILESPGGVVQDFGLLASQLSRLRTVANCTTIESEISSDEMSPIDSTQNTTSSSSSPPPPPPIQLTICVDKIAASGGYMLASQASPQCLYASPFSMIGSIGVMSERMNLSNLLKRWGIQPLKFSSGEGKNPVGLLSDVTKEGKDFVQRDIDRIYEAFKEYVRENRNMTALDIEKVATGEVWLGTKALELGLVDKIKTSDEYLLEKVLRGDTVLLRLMKYDRQRTGVNLGGITLWDFLFMKKRGRDMMRGKFGVAFLKTMSAWGASSVLHTLWKQGNIGFIEMTNHNN